MGQREKVGVDASATGGSQTLLRGLDIIEAIGRSPMLLDALAAELGLSKSTTHRLATTLVERGYLSSAPRAGYRLGGRLLDLGSRAQRQIDLIQIARPHLEALANLSGDTVHLGVRSDDHALYLDKIPGSRRIEISSRVGELQPLTTTGLGKALLLDGDSAAWEALRVAEEAGGDQGSWLARMRAYALAGHAFDLEENEDRIRCVAAPVRDANGSIAAAISVSGAAQYMDDGRMTTLARDVRRTADAIGAGLGWRGE